MAANLSNATSFVGVYSPFCTEVSPVWIFFRSTRFVCMDCLIFRFIDLMKLHGAFWEAKWGKQSEVWFRWSPHPCARRCPTSFLASRFHIHNDSFNEAASDHHWFVQLFKIRWRHLPWWGTTVFQVTNSSFQSYTSIFFLAQLFHRMFSQFIHGLVQLIVEALSHVHEAMLVFTMHHGL